PGITERPPTGVSYCGFLDAASGTGRDSMVGAVAHAEADPHGGAPLVVLDAVLELRPPFDALAACSEIAEFFARYRLTEVLADKYAAGFTVAAFQRAGASCSPSRPNSPAPGSR